MLRTYSLNQDSLNQDSLNLDSLNLDSLNLDGQDWQDEQDKRQWNEHTFRVNAI